ncbi:MAG: hypothetical protein V7K21_18845 [Nostoc sp.]|uniref:hypothetical protein n=1 Tax=Nostoc sp. TaxID=1180 RepID=UPI002FFA6041
MVAPMELLGVNVYEDSKPKLGIRCLRDGIEKEVVVAFLDWFTYSPIFSPHSQAVAR